MIAFSTISLKVDFKRYFYKVLLLILKELFLNPNPIFCFMQIKHLGQFKRIFLKMIFVSGNMFATDLKPGSGF
jgi:hypothetical protein